MSTFEYSGINSSAIVDFLAKADLTAPKGIFLALDSDGAKLPSAGGDVVGIALISNPDAVAAGGRVDVQVKDIGLVYAAASFAAGALLATDAYGKAKAAASTNTIVARALEPAAAAGDLVKVQLINSGAVVAS